MKVLVISQPVWSEQNNSGNTLSNIFSTFDAEFANIYFSEGEPMNTVCNRYYQVTDKMVINRILKHKKIGKSFVMDCKDSKSYASQTNFEVKAKRYNNYFMSLMRELAWKMVKVDTDELYAFIDEFKPDVIYAPCYGNFRMLRIVYNIQKKTNLPLISYISDDLYTYRTSEKWPIRHFMKYQLRKSLKKVWSCCDRLYTMTQEQKEEYEPYYGSEIYILRKNASLEYKTHPIQDPIKIIYGGGIYFGREDVLASIAKNIQVLNAEGYHFELHVYTNGKVSEENAIVLNDGKQSFLHDGIMYDELMKEYQSSDIALHVESFDQEFEETTRLSFSTKILDCLQSGAAVFVIAPRNNAGVKYLERENAALCIHDISEIKESLIELKNKHDAYAERAKACLMKNHNRETNTKSLENDFCKVILNHSI